MKLNILISLCLFLLFTCSHTEVQPTQSKQTGVLKLTILHINDTHGHFQKFDEKNNPNIGGFAAISTLVKEIRKEVKDSQGNLLFLHGGDLNTGIPESDMLNAEPDVVALNKMELNAIVLGNHEFDKPLEVLDRQMSQAKFQFLSANVTSRETGKPITSPFLQETIDGTKIYILGLTTDELKTLLVAEKYNKLNVNNSINAAKNYIKQFEKDSLIIGLTHLGFEGEGKSAGDIQLAKEVPAFDLIIGGHSHTILKKPVTEGKTLIVQAGYYGMALGRLDLKILNGEIIDYRYRYIPINAKVAEEKNGKTKFAFLEKEIKEDPEILALLKPYIDKVSDKLSEVIGNNKTYLARKDSRTGEIALGNIITDAMAKKGACDVAIQGAGGIRADLPDGKIMLRTIYAIHPFNNTIVKTIVTAGELVEILKQGYFRDDLKGFLQISGMTIELNNKEKSVALKTVKSKPIAQSQTIVLCSDNFLAGGGDGFTFLKGLSGKQETGLYVHDGLIEYIKEIKEVNYKTEGRITIH